MDFLCFCYINQIKDISEWSDKITPELLYLSSIKYDKLQSPKLKFQKNSPKKRKQTPKLKSSATKVSYHPVQKHKSSSPPSTTTLYYITNSDEDEDQINITLSPTNIVNILSTSSHDIVPIINQTYYNSPPYSSSSTKEIDPFNHYHTNQYDLHIFLY